MQASLLGGTSKIICPCLWQDVEYIGEDPNYHNRVCGLKIPNLGYEDNSRWTVEVRHTENAPWRPRMTPDSPLPPR